MVGRVFMCTVGGYKTMVQINRTYTHKKEISSFGESAEYMNGKFKYFIFYVLFKGDLLLLLLSYTNVYILILTDVYLLLKFKKKSHKNSI
jgi:hypothetical protein